MTARKLPDLDTLLWLRRTLTLKEIGALYGASGVAVKFQLAHAEALMRETKRLAWAAWEAKQKKGVRSRE